MATVKKKAHKLAWVKVNVSVDSGIADLVAAFSRIEGLETLASCQGWLGGGEAFVYFYYGDWQMISRLAFEKIATAIQGIDGAAISVEIFNGSRPMGKLGIAAGALSAVISALIPVLNPRKN